MPFIEDFWEAHGKSEFTFVKYDFKQNHNSIR